MRLEKIEESYLESVGRSQPDHEKERLASTSSGEGAGTSLGGTERWNGGQSDRLGNSVGGM